MKQKGISAILILVVIALLSVISFWYLNQQKDDPKPIRNESTSSSQTNTSQAKFTFIRDGDIWVKDGEDEKKLTDYKHNYSPTLSSDLSKIAYLSVPIAQVEWSETVTHVGGHGLTRNIWIINFDGTDPEKLTEQSGYYSNLQFSPNGKYLAYNSPGNIIVFDLQTKQILIDQSIPGGGASPQIYYTWGQDSESIGVANINNLGQGSESLNGITAWRINLKPRALTELGQINSFASSQNMEYSISPDLKLLSYFGQKYNTSSGSFKFDWGYYLANLDGSNPKMLLGETADIKSHGSNINFSWSKNGDLLAFFDYSFEEGKPPKSETILYIYDLRSETMKSIEMTNSSSLIWDSNNNLYMIRSGDQSIVQKVNYNTNKLEDFLQNASDINF